MSSSLITANVLDFGTLTVSNSAVSLADASPPLPQRCRRALITIEDDQIRWRVDGTAPSSSEGHLMDSGDDLDFTWGNMRLLLTAIQFIRVTADAKLKITYFD